MRARPGRRQVRESTEAGLAVLRTWAPTAVPPSADWAARQAQAGPAQDVHARAPIPPAVPPWTAPGIGPVSEQRPMDRPGIVVPRSVLAGPLMVAVVAVHHGAGASTVALTLADAAAAAGMRTRLVDLCRPEVSGLAAAADTELGVSADLRWQRGRRGMGQLVVDRDRGEADGQRPAGVYGELAGQLGDELVVVDGASEAAAAAGVGVVLVARATYPGLARLEAAINGWGAAVCAAAVVGTSRWGGQLASVAGPATGLARQAGRLALVPPDRQLELEGPSARPLPGKVLAAGRELFAAVIGAAPVAAGGTCGADDGKGTQR